MRIVITRWGLDAYLALLHGGVFTQAAYWQVLRPDILRLRGWPTDPWFREARSWGPARDRPNTDVPQGYKMKWHNLGNGNVQLRLCVGLVEGSAYLCHAYVKTSAELDRREAAKLKMRISLIHAGTYQSRGEL